MMFEIIKLVGSGIVGGLIAAYAGHRFTLRRERISGRQNRKREFLSFMEQWRSEVASASNESLRLGVDAIVQAYQLKVSLFHAQTALVQDAFSDLPRFRQLADRVGSLGARDWQGKQPRDVILEAMDALVRFTNDT